MKVFFFDTAYNTIQHIFFLQTNTRDLRNLSGQQVLRRDTLILDGNMIKEAKQKGGDNGKQFIN